MNLDAIQHELRSAGVDGWLFFDHHQRDPLAYRVLGLDPSGHVSRRWYYFVPSQGQPRGMVHRVEPHQLAALPGEQILYSRWQEQMPGLRALLFSIEPGLYLPEFGVRSEVDVFVDEHGARVTGAVQQEIATL